LMGHRTESLRRPKIAAGTLSPNTMEHASKWRASGSVDLF
jgi:hypothetical protein